MANTEGTDTESMADMDTESIETRRNPITANDGPPRSLTGDIHRTGRRLI